MQDDPASAGLLKRRRTLLGSDEDHGCDEDNGDEDFDDDSDEKDETADIEKEDREGENGAADAAFRSREDISSDSAVQWKEANRDIGDNEDEYKDEEEDKMSLERHHKKHHKHHKKHKKKHSKDRQQCRYLEGLTRSFVKFGTSSGKYLALSHGNNTCYQAVSLLFRSCDNCQSHASMLHSKRQQNSPASHIPLLQTDVPGKLCCVQPKVLFMRAPGMSHAYCVAGRLHLWGAAPCGAGHWARGAP